MKEEALERKDTRWGLCPDGVVGEAAKRHKMGKGPDFHGG